MRWAAGLALVVVLASACSEPVIVEPSQGTTVNALVAVDGPAIGFGARAATPEGGPPAPITSIEAVLDSSSTCSPETSWWLSDRPIGGVWMDEPEWRMRPFAPYTADGFTPQAVLSVAPGDECVPGDVIRFSGYVVRYDDRGFPKTATSTSSRFEVAVVAEFNR
ncbi:MAG: hypothetical protein AAGE98_21750 [Actinomycetota bacterium]